MLLQERSRHATPIMEATKAANVHVWPTAITMTSTWQVDTCCSKQLMSLLLSQLLKLWTVWKGWSCVLNDLGSLHLILGKLVVWTDCSSWKRVLLILRLLKMLQKTSEERTVFLQQKTLLSCCKKTEAAIGCIADDRQTRSATRTCLTNTPRDAEPF